MSDAGLYTALLELVERHGIEDVESSIAIVRAALAQPKTRGRSEKFATAYEGWIVTSTDAAILWWIPSDGLPGAESGQATWIPRVLVIEAIDRSALSPLGVIRTTKPIAWRPAKRLGRDITFLDARRSA